MHCQSGEVVNNTNCVLIGLHCTASQYVDTLPGSRVVTFFCMCFAHEDGYGYNLMICVCSLP